MILEEKHLQSLNSDSHVQLRVLHRKDNARCTYIQVHFQTGNGNSQESPRKKKKNKSSRINSSSHHLASTGNRKRGHTTITVEL